jgi:hypothetical protein
MKIRLIFTGLLLSGMVLSFSAGVLPASVTAVQSSDEVVRGVCEFYYGGHSTTQVNRIVAAKPEFLVVETPNGMFHTNSPVATYKAAGIKVFSYVAVSYCSDWQYTPSSPVPSDYNSVMAFVDAVADEGDDGIFFDESPFSLYEGRAGYPPSGSWTGHTIKEAIDKAHSRGLMVMLGLGDSPRNANLFIADYVLSDERYAGRNPASTEANNLAQCIVIGHNVSNATDAAAYTNTALAKGFRAAYHCDVNTAYGAMPSWFENYMALVNKPTSTPISTHTPDLTATKTSTSTPSATYETAVDETLIAHTPAHSQTSQTPVFEPVPKTKFSLIWAIIGVALIAFMVGLGIYKYMEDKKTQKKK